MKNITLKVVTIKKLIKFHNKHLNNLYSLPNSIRILKSKTPNGKECIMHGRDHNFVQSAGHKPEGQRLPGIHRHRWEDNNI